jgi:hypothetical protein
VKVAVAMLVVEGGKNTLKAVQRATKEKIPTVVMQVRVGLVTTIKITAPGKIRC